MTSADEQSLIDSAPPAASVHLIGGGWDEASATAVYGPFLTEAGAAAARVGRPGKPVIACVVFDEGDGRAQFSRWEAVLTAAAFCEPVPVLVSDRAPLGIGRLGNADGLLVCGGLTPGYAAAVTPAAVDVLDWLVVGARPYAGFSAGSSIAAIDAVVGGWLDDGIQVCPQDAGEDLEELTIRPGLGLVPFAVDVHCAQWGTLPRLIAAVRAVPGRSGVGIDENTVLIVNGHSAVVSGRGNVWLAREHNGAVAVRPLSTGERFEF